MKMKDLLEHELRTWVQYFIIMLIAGTVSGWALENARAEQMSAGIEQGAVAINFNGLISGLWNDYYRWLVCAFVGLSLVRLLIVIIIHRRATQI